MEVTYDLAKNARNIAERGLSFDQAANFDFAGALLVTDDRRDYGEVRIQAIGRVGERVLVFVQTSTGIRVISFRKANKREVSRYEQATQP